MSVYKLQFFWIASFLLLIGIIARNSVLVGYEVVLAFILVAFVLILKQIKEIKEYRQYSNTVLWFKFLLLFLVLNFMAEAFHLYMGEGYSGQASGFFERYLHLFFIMMLFFLAMDKKNKVVFFWRLLILSTFVVLWVLVYEVVQVGFEKVISPPFHRFGWLGSSYFIDFGIYSNTLFISLWAAFLWRKELGRFWVGLLIVALIISFSGAVLSQSRTAWIGWPEALLGWGGFYVYRILHRKQYKKIVLLFLTFFIVLIAVLNSPVKTVLEQRITQAFVDVGSYINGEPKSSVGLRFVMYEAALKQIEKAPWLGIGENRFYDVFNKEVSNIEVSQFGQQPGNYSFTHTHNQFLMSWVVRGIVGFISVLMLFGILFYLFSRQIRQTNSEQEKGLGVLGMVFSVAAFLTFMPESPLHNTTQLLFFFLMSTMFIMMLDVQKNEKLILNNSSS
jgi:O-antigen ligase